MESHGAPGCIQISDETRALLGDRFATEERGIIEFKGKGAMRTWWLRGIDSCENEKSRSPTVP